MWAFCIFLPPTKSACAAPLKLKFGLPCFTPYPPPIFTHRWASNTFFQPKWVHVSASKLCINHTFFVHSFFLCTHRWASYTFLQPKWVHVPYLRLAHMLIGKAIGEALDRLKPDLVVSVGSTPVQCGIDAHRRGHGGGGTQQRHSGPGGGDGVVSVLCEKGLNPWEACKYTSTLVFLFV